MTRSIDRVRIGLARGIVDLPWAAREALLDRVQRLDEMADVRRAFEAVGTSRSVRLTQVQKRTLVDTIEQWGSEVEGGLRDGLPEGIFELRNALLDDLHDRGDD